MQAFSYRAVHKSGRIQKGEMAAANENELAFTLRQLDLELISARRTQSSALATRRPQRINNADTDILNLCSQLGDLLDSGLPFSESMDLILASMPGSHFQSRLASVAGAVRSGQSVSKAFAQHPDLFDPVFLSVLRSGEAGSDLSAAFQRLHQQQTWQIKIKKDLKRAVRYPLFLLCLAIGVTSFMLAFVIPQIVLFLSSLGSDLPFATRLMIRMAEIFSTLWWMIPVLACTAWGLFALVRRSSPSGAAHADRFLLNLPGLGPVLKKLALARFSASLTILYQSGLSLPKALELAGHALGNAYLTGLAAQAQKELIAGRAFSDSCLLLYPASITQRLKIAEQSGTLAQVLSRIAENQETEAHAAVDSFLDLLEPSLTLLVGAFMAWIVLAVLGPLYGALTPLAGGM